MAKDRVERDEEDLVRLYLTDIGQYTLLTKDDEVRLAKLIEGGKAASENLEKAGKDVTAAKKRDFRKLIREGEDAQQAFVQSNLRLVVSIAKKYQASGLPLLDLIQEGNLGLMHAVEKFDWRKGFKFSTYATWWIRQAITRGIANTGRTIRLPVHAGDTLARLQKARSRLELKLGRPATLSELSAEVEMPEEKVTEALRFAAEPLSLSEPLREDGDAELVLLPTPREIQTGRGARPFRLRWAMATAAGLTVALLTIRTISDRDWTVGKVINPVPDRHREVAAVEPLPSTHQEAEERLRNMKSANATSGGNAPVVAAPSPAASSPAAPNLAGPPATAPSETEVARPEKALEKFEVATSPREYLAEVDQVIRKEAALGSTQSAPASDLSMDESRSWGVAARNSAEAGKTSAQSSTDPEYAMVFAAASRAREAGNQALARRGFALVRAGIPEDDLAREAEYEETLATARMEIANGGDQVVITQRLNDDAASSWDAHAPDQKLTCRTALADLRAAMTLARELGRPLPLEDVDTRLQQLRSCAR